MMVQALGGSVSVVQLQGGSLAQRFSYTRVHLNGVELHGGFVARGLNEVHLPGGSVTRGFSCKRVKL